MNNEIKWVGPLEKDVETSGGPPVKHLHSLLLTCARARLAHEKLQLTPYHTLVADFSGALDRLHALLDEHMSHDSKAKSKRDEVQANLQQWKGKMQSVVKGLARLKQYGPDIPAQEASKGQVKFSPEQLSGATAYPYTIERARDNLRDAYQSVTEDARKWLTRTSKGEGRYCVAEFTPPALDALHKIDILEELFRSSGLLQSLYQKKGRPGKGR